MTRTLPAIFLALPVALSPVAALADTLRVALVLPGSITIGLVLLWAAAILTLYSGWDYMKASIEHVPDD